MLAPQTSHSHTFTFSMIETNEITMEVAYRADNVEKVADGSLSILRNGREHEHRVYVFDVLLADGRERRTVVPNGVVKESAEVAHTSTTAIAYGVTLGALPDANGNTASMYVSPKPAPANPTE